MDFRLPRGISKFEFGVVKLSLMAIDYQIDIPTEVRTPAPKSLELGERRRKGGPAGREVEVKREGLILLPATSLVFSAGFGFTQECSSGDSGGL